MKKFFGVILKIIAILILVAIALFVCNKIMQVLDRYRAEKNAISYIEKKYGFSPEVLSSKKDYDVHVNADIFISYSKTPTGNYQVKMQHDGKDFTVYIPYKKASDGGTDDYQSDEIASAIQAEVSSCFDGKVMAIHNYQDSRMGFRYIEADYFDGSDTEKFYRENASYYVYTVGCDLKSLDLKGILKKFHASSIYVFDCVSEEAFNDFYGQNPFDILQPEMDGISIDAFRPYLDECAIQKTDEEKEYLKPNMREYGDFLYDTVFGGNVEFTPIEGIDLQNWRGNKTGATASGYSVKSAEKTFIFVPRIKLNGVEKQIYLLYSYTDKNGETKYSYGNDVSINDYYRMFSIYDSELKDFEFTIVREK